MGPCSPFSGARPLYPAGTFVQAFVLQVIMLYFLFRYFSMALRLKKKSHQTKNLLLSKSSLTKNSEKMLTSSSVLIPPYSEVEPPPNFIRNSYYYFGVKLKFIPDDKSHKTLKNLCLGTLP